MAIQEGTALSGDHAGPEAEQALFLLGSGSRQPVQCTTRWRDDRHAYVVAPLATARAARQQWQALTCPPDGDPAAVREPDLNVELVAANALLGADSGKEGLLLRYFPRKPGTA